METSGTVWLLRTMLPGIKSLTLHKLRSALTILGVVFGVASVIVMLAIGEGTKEAALRQIQELGSTNVILRSVKPSEESSSQSGAIRYGLTLADLRRIEHTIPTVRAAVPVREHGRGFRRLSHSLEGRVVAVKPEFQELQGLLLQQGRFLSELDCQQLAAVCLLSAESASTLFPLEDPLGQAIRIGEDRYFQVVGVLASPAAASAGNHRSSGDDGRVVYIPFDTDRARFGEIVSIDRGGGQLPEILEISQITVAVDSMDHVKPTAALIRDMIAAHHPQPDTEVTVPLELLEKAEQTQRMFGLVLSAIASISLVVGGIGIMNIMLATVTERTREIGIRRALGARRRDIIWQFVVETMILSGSGGLLGVAGGLLVAFLIPYVFGISAIVQLWSPLLAFTISLLVGVAFGAYPARRAAFMDPIQALRHE